MTAADDAWMLDTNVLLAATDESRPQHAASTELLDSVSSLSTSAQVMREYLVVATRPVAANGLGMSLKDALANLRELRSRVRLLPEEKPILPAFLDLLNVVECRGKRIHDAHLVATAKLHRVGSIVTLNGKDFAAFAAHVVTLTPAQALAASRGTP